MQAPNIVRNHSRQKAAVGLHVTVSGYIRDSRETPENNLKNRLII